MRQSKDLRSFVNFDVNIFKGFRIPEWNMGRKNERGRLTLIRHRQNTEVIHLSLSLKRFRINTILNDILCLLTKNLSRNILTIY